jgi:cytochrome c-type biogenesis protein CcmH
MGLRRIACHLVVALQVVCSTYAFAVQPDEMMRDPAQEARARALSRELRCMVCQNQSIDDSDAPLARDLRLLVRERIGAGDTDSQVMDFLVARYGAFVLLKPRFEAQTYALWLLPPLALGIGAILLLLAVRRRRLAGELRGDTDVAPLNSEEQAQLAELIGDKNFRDRNLGDKNLGDKDFSPSSGSRDPRITKV